MKELKALLTIYTFTDLRPQAEIVLETIEFLMRKFPSTKTQIKYKAKEEKGSGWRVLTPGLLLELKTKARAGNLWEIDMQTSRNNPDFKMLTRLASNSMYFPSFVSMQISANMLNIINANDLIDIGGFLFDSLKAVYGCVIVGYDSFSLLHIAFGLQSNILTPPENTQAKIWCLNSPYASEFLRDVYWISFIKSSIKGPYEDLPKLFENKIITAYKLLKTGAAFSLAEKASDFESEKTQKNIKKLKQIWKRSLMPENALPFKERS